MDYYDEPGHAATVANCCKRCQAGETAVSLTETGRSAGQPQTAPVAAEPTSFAYFASTPVR
ncbi:MAG: hypothetical protein QOJ03_757 [Frankiaceae bacterium]|jgi:hypothetical protein|nr:hypothetical protein [Frankiaceae bacterium]